MEFLKNLKKAVEEGEFNSDAANKINEINELAEKKYAEVNSKKTGKIYEDAAVGVNKLEDSLKKRVDDVGHKTVTEEEAKEVNSEYEKKMTEFKKIDLANKQLASITEMEDMILASIEDMIMYCEELEGKLEDEFDRENPKFGDLYQKIEFLKSKYNPIIN
ncbi:MAG: hypothetical protein ACOC22_00275 [bacterium]